jgi:hypothetical protein
MTRAIPLSIHGAIEVIAAPAIMAAPFVLDFGQAAAVVTVLFGVLLMGLALQVPGPRRSISLATHASFDYLLAGFGSIAGIAVALITGEWLAALFLVGVGVALVALAASTRFSAPVGA